MEFIRITADNFNKLKDLHIAYKAEIGEGAPTDAELDRLITAIKSNQIYFFGCVYNGEPVACCSVSPTFSTFNYQSSGIFEDFYIKPEHRRQGIAKKLVDYAYNESKLGL